MKSILPTSLAFGFLLAASITVTARSEPRHHREHSAHEHGVAELKLALSDHDLSVEFDSPAVNLVGFEHAATSEKDRQVVANVAQNLRLPLTFLALPSAAHCTLTKTAVESELLGNATDTSHSDHKNGHEGHADFMANYQFHCKDPQALNVVGVLLFETFTDIERISAQWLTATSQNAKVLTPADHFIRLQ